MLTLNFGGDGYGGDIVVLLGTAEVLDSGASAAQHQAWVARHAADWKRSGMTADSFAQRLSILVQIRISAVHGH